MSALAIAFGPHPYRQRSTEGQRFSGDVYWRMANSSKIGRTQRKAAGQRNRVRDVKARAKKSAKRRRSARASKAAAAKPATKTSPASS